MQCSGLGFKCKTQASKSRQGWFWFYMQVSLFSVLFSFVVVFLFFLFFSLICKDACNKWNALLCPRNMSLKMKTLFRLSRKYKLLVRLMKTDHNACMRYYRMSEHNQRSFSEFFSRVVGYTPVTRFSFRQWLGKIYTVWWVVKLFVVMRGAGLLLVLVMIHLAGLCISNRIIGDRFWDIQVCWCWTFWWNDGISLVLLFFFLNVIYAWQSYF